MGYMDGNWDSSRVGSESSGVLSDLPGARIEAVPGPDGYSGCGLEKPSFLTTDIDEEVEKRQARVNDWIAAIGRAQMGYPHYLAERLVDLEDAIKGAK